ncbi:hypothetical protein QWY28_17280 [Nocardioides sp. SOB77]|uniref:Uncharacterized protein n=1 Tax=Nocardioides oceani TaxID=3058369 RepID=A0ABT8FKR0_9ACTN|nr:hypothetical protein [Nocardioides oceani]MDN4174717.1 hypothetical protein [Nocardioides oceani]
MSTQPKGESDGLREYEVWSTYKVDGVAIIRARSAAEAVRKGLDVSSDDPVEFVFSEPYGETRMRARLLFPPAPTQPVCGQTYRDRDGDPATCSWPAGHEGSCW